MCVGGWVDRRTNALQLAAGCEVYLGLLKRCISSGWFTMPRFAAGHSTHSAQAGRTRSGTQTDGGLKTQASCASVVSCRTVIRQFFTFRAIFSASSLIPTNPMNPNKKLFFLAFVPSRPLLASYPGPLRSSSRPSSGILCPLLASSSGPVRSSSGPLIGKGKSGLPSFLPSEDRNVARLPLRHCCPTEDRNKATRSRGRRRADISTHYRALHAQKGQRSKHATTYHA